MTIFDVDFPGLQAEVPASGIRTLWIRRVRNFQDGQLEMSVSSSYVSIHGFTGDRRPPKRRKGGEGVELSVESLERSVARSKRSVRHRCKAIGANYMVTLTVRENIQDFERFKSMFNLFRRRIRAAQESFAYVAVPEQQQRGAWHLHMAVYGRQNLRLLRAVWQSVCGGPGMGAVHIKAPLAIARLKHRLGGYLCKYLGKDFEGQKFGARRYWSSDGIVVPEVVQETVAEGEGVQVELEALSSGIRYCLGRETTWHWDHVRKVLYISAGPPDPAISFDDCPF